MEEVISTFKCPPNCPRKPTSLDALMLMHDKAHELENKTARAKLIALAERMEKEPVLNGAYVGKEIREMLNGA